MDFGFPEDKILGTFHTNCPAWNVKIKETKCKVSWALRLAGGIYTYQLTVDVGPLKKGGSGKSKIRGQKSDLKIVLSSVFCPAIGG